jgi:hypothetical protein
MLSGSNTVVYMRKFRRDRLQSHIWLTAASYMVKYLRISSHTCTRKPFLLYDFATATVWGFLIYEENFFFFFISVPGGHSWDRSFKSRYIIFSFFVFSNWYKIIFAHLVLRISRMCQRRGNCPLNKHGYNLKIFCWAAHKNPCGCRSVD